MESLGLGSSTPENSFSQTFSSSPLPFPKMTGLSVVVVVIGLYVVVVVGFGLLPRHLTLLAWSQISESGFQRRCAGQDFRMGLPQEQRKKLRQDLS